MIKDAIEQEIESVCQLDSFSELEYVQDTHVHSVKEKFLAWREKNKLTLKKENK